MENEKKTFLKKSPLANKVVCKISNGLFDALDTIIDDGMDASPRAKNIVKKITRVCQDIVYDEFPTSPRAIPAKEVKLRELPASTEVTSEEVATKAPEQIVEQKPQTKMFADGE